MKSVGVVGLGVAGFPVAAILGTTFDVLGIDLDQNKVEKINNRTFLCADEEGSREIIKKSKLKASCDIKDLKDRDAIILILPTTSTDFSKIEETLQKINSFHHGDMIISSTVYPGFIRKMQEKYQNVTVSYVPLRTFEGRAFKQFFEFPHIIGTFDEKTYDRISVLYKNLNCRTFSVIPPEKAEIVKLFSNTFRQSELALAAELGEIARLHGFDPAEIFRLTNEGDNYRNLKKPGIWGGYCLPKDTNMLIEHAKNNLNYSPHILVASEDVRKKILHLRADELIKKSNGRKILIEGITAKPVEEKIIDMRDSPVVEIIKLLKQKKADLRIHDPNLPKEILHKISDDLGVKVACEDDFSNSFHVKHTNHDLFVIKK